MTLYAEIDDGDSKKLRLTLNEDSEVDLTVIECCGTEEGTEEREEGHILISLDELQSAVAALIAGKP